MRQLLSSANSSLSSVTRLFSPVLIVALLLAALPAARAGQDQEMTDLFNRFFTLGLDTARSAPVSGVTIERDGIKIQLESGRLWFAEPLAGEITGAHFIGKGKVFIHANGLAGVNMLKATLSNNNSGVSIPGNLPAEMIHQPASGEKEFRAFEASFTEIFLRFDDDLDEELVGLMEESTEDASAAISSFKKRSKDAYEMPGGGLEKDFILKTLSGLERFPFFLAEFRIGTEWLTYFNSGSSAQEVWVGTHPPLGAGSTQRIFTWTAFDLEEDYDDTGHWDADLLLDQKPLLDISKIEMVIDLQGTVALTIDAKVTFSPLADTLAVVPFDLINNLGYNWWEKGGRPVILNSVQDAEGRELDFIHMRNAVLVRMPSPLQPGVETTLRFQAEENTIIQLGDYSWRIMNTYAWYPQHGYVGGRFAIDWTIKVKNPNTAIASGRLVEEKEEGGKQVTRWVTDQEVSFPSFIFGRFSSREDIYKSEKTGREIVVGVHAQPMGDFRGTSKMKSVSKEAQQILKLFEEFFGPYPYDRLDVTQMAVGMGFGQAPPGLLFLTGEAFISSGLLTEMMSRQADRTDSASRSPYFHDFFAHEIAHQWFGHDILWGRDEDVWLSEAFAEYASAIYAEQLDGPKKFQEKLARWGESAQLGEKSGFPIAGASFVSASSSATAGGYRNDLVYNKGAYVVHMMRSLMGPDKFLASMQAFLNNRRGGMVTTQMLKEDVEEVSGIPMDWFFDQWFYTAGTPTLKFSYQTQKSEDGGVVLTGRIVQDAEDWKQIVIPVYYDLGGKQPSIQRQAVGSPDFTFKAKLPSEPKRVWLDEEHSVLADIVIENK